MSFSEYRKAALYRPEAVLVAEEIKSQGIEAILEHRFYRENTYHCTKHGIFTDESNYDSTLCPICSLLCTKAFYQVDIFLPDNNICIEIKGRAHDSDTRKEKDLHKEEYLRNHFGVETISARAEWLLDARNHEPRYEWIAMYAEGVAKLLQAKSMAEGL